MIRATSHPPVLTDAGRAWLEARLGRITQQLDRIAADLERERSEDLLRDRQQLTTQAEELTKFLRAAVAPADIRDDPEIVELGDEVEIEFPDGSRDAFLVVHPMEAGMDEHRTSSEAPLAQAVLGHRPGDHITVQTPGGVYGCKLISRRRID